MADSVPDGSPLIELNDEVDGHEIGSRNYRFAKIGEPVPIKSGDAAEFDPECLPSRPLVVSERFRLLFVVHPQGFYVSRTKDIMGSAEKIKEKQEGPSVQESSLVDVAVGKISVLALSADDSVIAACVATHVHFFAVSALLHKEKKPSYSVSLDESIHIKDFCWARKVCKDYIVLADSGKLYRGSGQGPLSYVMEDVDAVDWSVKGNFVALARKNKVSILSSQFKKKLSFLLQFQSVTGYSDISQLIKVDSIKWVRSDCIAVGCFQINKEGDEENYIIQVITNKGRKITDVSGSKPTVLSFNSVFMDFSTDAVPAKNGPHLLLSYLDHWGLAFVANRNLSQRVGLFCWSLDKGGNEIAMVDILNDAWNLYIDSRDDGEENVIVGLCLDQVPQNENATFVLGDKEAEVSPCCVILCLTIDGKISAFHFACAAGTFVPPKGCNSDEEVDDCETSTTHEVHLISPADDKDIREPNVAMADSSGFGGTETVHTGAEPSTTKSLPFSFNVDGKSREQTKSETTGQRPIIHPLAAQLVEAKKIFPVNHSNNEDGGSVSDAKNSIGLFTGKAGGDISHQFIRKCPASSSSMEPRSKVPPTSSENLWSLPKLNPTKDASKTSDESSTKHPFNIVDNSNKPAFQSVESVPQYPTDLKEKGKPSVTFSSFGTLSTGQVSRSSVPAYSVSPVPIGEGAASGKYLQPEHKKGFKVASSSTVLPFSAQSTSKQFGNVEETAKKLDSLLEGIEGKGGFRDASITSQSQRLTGLEEDICALSKRCSIWRGLMDKQLREIQLLFDKMIQVSVRKVYMEGIFKQAQDSRYWELWNRQKLSSELELKRRCILKLNQELTSKLIELERHFNSLEFNKFGENGGMQNNRRVLSNWQGPSRKFQSLHSLHNTIQSQLAAAEQLSVCLSEQMAALSIESSGKLDLKKQLFECIGLSYVDETPRSLTKDMTFGTPSQKVPSITTGAFTAKEQSKRSLATFAKNEEPETARRRRESLDHSWASFDPPTMTVKRTLKEDYEKGSANHSFAHIDKPYLRFQMQNKFEVVNSAHPNLSGASVSHTKTKGPTEIQTEQFANNSTSVFQKTSDLLDHGLQVSTSRSAPLTFETSKPENRELGGSVKLADERPKSSLPFTGKIDSLAASTSKFVQKPDTSFNSLPSAAKWLPEHLSTPPSGSTEKVDLSKIGFTMSTSWDEKNGLVESGTPLFGTKSHATPTSNFSSGLDVSEKGLFTKSVDKPSKSNDGLSASTPLQSVVGPSFLSSNTFSSVSSFVSKTSSSTVYPVTPSSGSIQSTGVESSSQPRASVTSTLNFASALPSTHASSLSSLSYSASDVSEPLTSLSHPPVVMTDKINGNASHAETSVVSVTSKTIEEDEIQASATKPRIPVSAFDLKLGLSASSKPAEVSSDASSSSKISSAVTLDTTLVLPQATEAVSPVAPSTEAIFGSLRNAIPDVSNEEEMEEEAPETQQTTELGIGSLGGFGLGTTPNSTLPKSNPFGVGILKQDSPISTSPMIMPFSSNELFRPASFNFQSPQPLEPAVSFPGGFGSGNPGQVSGGAAFGQPAHIGAGQQALGSVLGTFGQSRQFGAGQTGSNAASASGFGVGAFGGGFLAAVAGGYATAANAGVGGFAAAATSGGGFAAVASAVASTSGSGFASVGAGFASASSAAGANPGGGFGAFGNQQQGIAGVPQSQLFTQMRK